MKFEQDYINSIKGQLKGIKNIYVIILRSTKAGHKVCRFCYCRKGVMFSFDWEIARAFNYRRDKTGAIYCDPDQVLYLLGRYCGIKPYVQEI